MKDGFDRVIDYLRISITDRCNLRCDYCMPSGGIKLVPEDELLSFEEIEQAARSAVRLGVKKIRLTGGEPLVRRGVEDLVRMLACIRGLDDLAMTTNGTLLAGHAERLAAAGLRRVNVSLSTLDPNRYHQVTRGGDIREVLDGVEAACRAGLKPIKINCVVEANALEPEASRVAFWAGQHGLEVRFIRRMNLGAGLYWPIEGGTGGDCKRCNRLRLTNNGFIKPCLFSDIAFSVRDLGPEQAITSAVLQKPKHGDKSSADSMCAIGG